MTVIDANEVRAFIAKFNRDWMDDYMRVLADRDQLRRELQAARVEIARLQDELENLRYKIDTGEW